MKLSRVFLASTLMMVLLGACAGVEADPSPTATLLPEASPTSEPTVADAPLVTSTPTGIPAASTPEPQATQEGPFPEATIAIREPGAGSQVTSPVRVEVSLVPGYGGKVRFEIVGADGKPITRVLKAYEEAVEGEKLDLVEELDFEIETPTEVARLEISVDDTYRRVMTRVSVNLILLREGPPMLSSEEDLREWIVIQAPGPGEEVAGGMVEFSGVIRGQSEKNLGVELVNRQGEILITGFARVEVQEGAEYGVFSGEVPYYLDEATWARLVVHQRADKMTESNQLNSIELLLNP